MLRIPTYILTISLIFLVSSCYCKFENLLGRPQPLENSGGDINLETIGDELRNISNVGIHLWNKQNKQTNFYYKIKLINNITYQVVSGLIYKIDLVLEETECKKDGMDLTRNEIIDNLLKDCKSKNTKELNCSIKLWEKKWLNFLELVDPEDRNQPSECLLPSYVSQNDFKSKESDINLVDLS